MTRIKKKIMDVYASLIAQTNPGSLYYQETDEQVESFPAFVEESLKQFFLPEQQESFKKKLSESFNKILRSKISSSEKMIQMKKIVILSLYPQIRQNILYDFSESGVPSNSA